jgi:peptide/nickel transport system substrate-binding protein
MKPPLSRYIALAQRRTMVLMSRRGPLLERKGFGAFNGSRYSNARVDELLECGLASIDEKKREALAQEAMRLAMRDYAVIPLHHQVTTWAMKKTLAYAPRTEEYTFAHEIKAQ